MSCLRLSRSGLRVGGLVVGLALALGLASAATGAGPAGILAMSPYFPFPPPGAGAPAVPVTTTLVKEQDVATYLSGIGTASPLYAVTLKARVDGQLEKVFFTEGQDVGTGTKTAMAIVASMNAAEPKKIRRGIS